MERQKLYCPPTGNTPQTLPDYWRFDNRVIRRDLQSLDDAELHAWGWDGPFYQPILKQVIKNDENLPEDRKEQLLSDPDFIFDKEQNAWVSKEYDYDSTTQKVVWFSRERRFLIADINENVAEYEIPFRSGVALPEPPAGAEIYNGSAINVTPTENQLPPAPPVQWSLFKQSIIQSLEFNQYIGALLPVLPIVATSLPVAITSLENNKYENFRIVWGTLKHNAPPPAELITALTQLAVHCNVPQDFINIINGQ